MENRTKSNEIKKRWKIKNRDSYLAQQRMYAIERYKENIEHLREKERSSKRRLQKNKWVKKNTEYLKQKNKEYYKKNKFKFKARRLLNDAIKRGQVMRAEICSKCSSSLKIEGHHENYDKPFEVIWLCERCHKEHHRKY